MNQLWCQQKIYFKYTETERLKVKGWKRMYHANAYQKKARESIPDKVDIRKKEGYYLP